MRLGFLTLISFILGTFNLMQKISLLVQYPGLEPVLDDLLPKKSPLIVAKWSG